MLLTRARVQFIPNTLLKVAFISGSIRNWRKRGGKLTADYGVGKFQEFIFAYNSSPTSCLSSSKYLPSSLFVLSALHLIILYGIASILVKYKTRMLPRISHPVTRPRILVSYSSSCLREASDLCIFSFRSLWRLQ